MVRQHVSCTTSRRWNMYRTCGHQQACEAPQGMSRHVSDVPCKDCAMSQPAGCITVPRVEGQYSVPEATSGMGHRHSSIAHGIQLVQPARLKAGGHQQQITCSCDLVTHGHIEAHPSSCLVWICTLQPAHSRLQGHTLLCCHLPSGQPCTHALD